MPVCQLKDIVFGFKNRKLFDGLNLTFEAGEILAITGVNGSGKSTIAKLIMGICEPQRGEILFCGEDILQKSIDQRAKLGIAYSFQQTAPIRGMTVADLLNLASDYAYEDCLFEKFLAPVGLSEEYLERSLDSKLSGGEMKRIEIASVLAREAKLYIFDEPEAGIDLWSVEKLAKVFTKLRKDRPESAIVVITHSSKLLKIANKILVLKPTNNDIGCKNGDKSVAMRFFNNYTDFKEQLS